jgi:cytochrome c556|uniref:c-type cytochrome n=1 Tax=Orrella sp. TaxID=1921583 RepID=UPI00404816E7
MKKPMLAAVLIALASPFMAASANAQFFAKAEDAVKYRQGAFQMIKAHFSALQPVIKGQVPYDKARVAAEVSVLDVLSTLPWVAFGPGTEGGGALEVVWSDTNGFKAAQDKFLASLKPLTVAAQAGDLDKLRAAFVKTGASCKACHDNFRK